MKKAYLFVIITCIIGSFLFSQQTDIRRLKWGMSYAKVKEIENLEDTLYKQDELLGIKVEIVFGCGKSGLTSVIYSTDDTTFVQKASEKLSKKYGEFKKDMDYAFLIEAKDILMQHPKAVIGMLEQNDLTELNNITTGGRSNAKLIIKGGLAKRYMWEYNNTVALLLDNVTTAILSYRPKKQYNEDKEKFKLLVQELKKKIKDDDAKKQSEEMDNF
ncbi:MAG: hypothetical protein GY765_10015 [bacterium]|nr:hypothetical protein [bacterium]